jgi:hypothetical protein
MSGAVSDQPDLLNPQLCPACTRISWDIRNGLCRACRSEPDHVYCPACGSLLHLDDVEDLEQATAEFAHTHIDCETEDIL